MIIQPAAEKRIYKERRRSEDEYTRKRREEKMDEGSIYTKRFFVHSKYSLLQGGDVLLQGCVGSDLITTITSPV